MGPKRDVAKDAAKPKVTISAPAEVAPKAKNDGAKSPSPSPPRPRVAKDSLPPSKIEKAKSERPNTPDLAPKRSVPQRRRTNSLQAKEKPKMLATNSPNQPSKTSYTELEPHVAIPWLATFREGFGINALTGEFMAQRALQQFDMKETSKPGKSRISVERLQWSGVKNLQDGFEMEVGGTVNVLGPIGANAKFASVLSETTSTSTILVQYKVEADFSVDWIPENVKLKGGLDKLSDNEFRAEYGDYFIAGYQKAYSCRMIVVCKINEEAVTKSLEREVVALVDRYFKGKIKVFEIENQTKSFSLLSVIVDADGCSTGATSVFSVAVADAPQTLKNVLKNPRGIPRLAFLYHYSRLDSCKLSRRVDVPKDMFEKARAMRSLYTYIQASLLHPALQEFHWDRRTSTAVLKRFEDQQKFLLPTGKIDKKTKDIDTLHRDLTTKKNKAHALIQRYDFIRLVVEMDKSIVAHQPTPVNGQQFYRWDCGKTGASKKLTELKAYNLVSFGPYRAFELEWQSPVTDVSSALPQWLGGSSPRATMTFTTRGSDDSFPPPPRPPTPPSRLFKSRSPAQERDGAGDSDSETFAFCLIDHQPVYILGWSMSCYWPEGKSKPTIEVDAPSNHIFSDRLSISVDASRSTRWFCRVTFVLKSSYNFPDLLLLSQ
ncbi:hypothetical protein C8F04DRAFT_1250124 [Mycena alexandri]|uniref:Uncharacterized protein n=1 Tax=Mycena alexandri TaxID=1745969 RepID=A0AAD6TJA0_9AGAR|nr:hypothetical protein C8F04DRAFT_1250124 [Mycena alexandri]